MTYMNKFPPTVSRFCEEKKFFAGKKVSYFNFIKLKMSIITGLWK